MAILSKSAGFHENKKGIADHSDIPFNKFYRLILLPFQHTRPFLH